MNVTHEQELLDSMATWFAKGGGKLQFATPTITERGFKLVANEAIHDQDAVISAPLKLIMCKQTARNVMIESRGKYLGEELQKTFDKNELWGMTIFLLHEYYKETAGKGSKWGPFILSLRMRFLSTEVLSAIKGTNAAAMSTKWLKVR